MSDQIKEFESNFMTKLSPTLHSLFGFGVAARSIVALNKTTKKLKNLGAPNIYNIILF